MYDFSPILSRLKEAKKQSGLTNDELSLKSGVPIGTLRKIMSGGTQEPKLPAIIAISDALGVSADYIIYGRVPTPVPSCLSAAEAAVLDCFRQLNEEGQEKVKSYIDDLIRAGIYKKHSESFVVSKEA